MPIGQMSVSGRLPWLAAAARTGGASAGASSAPNTMNLASKAQQMQQQAMLFPLQVEAKRLANEQAAISNLTMQEQRVLRKESLELGNMSAAQGLVNSRRQANLSATQAHNTIAEQDRKWNDAMRTEGERGAVEEYKNLSRSEVASGVAANKLTPPPTNLSPDSAAEVRAAFSSNYTRATNNVASMAAAKHRENTVDLISNWGLSPDNAGDDGAVDNAKDRKNEATITRILAENNITQADAAASFGMLGGASPLGLGAPVTHKGGSTAQGPFAKFLDGNGLLDEEGFSAAAKNAARPQFDPIPPGHDRTVRVDDKGGQVETYAPPKEVTAATLNSARNTLFRAKMKEAGIGDKVVDFLAGETATTSDPQVEALYREADAEVKRMYGQGGGVGAPPQPPQTNKMAVEAIKVQMPEKKAKAVEEVVEKLKAAKAWSDVTGGLGTDKQGYPQWESDRKGHNLDLEHSKEKGYYLETSDWYWWDEYDGDTPFEDMLKEHVDELILLTGGKENAYMFMSGQGIGDEELKQFGFTIPAYATQGGQRRLGY